MRNQVAILLVVLVQAFPLAVTAQNAETATLPKNIAALAELATSGDLEAQLEIAQAYQYGIGITKNPIEAIRWYKAAAEQSSGPAMYQLGSLVFTGFTSVDTSPEAIVAAEESTNWFHRAAKLGFGPAQGTLGLLYGFGDRVEIDPVTGRMWMEIAAINEHPTQKTMKRALERKLSDQELALALSRAEVCIASSYTDCD